jgi:NitT/TauT family transport system permease protein
MIVVIGVLVFWMVMWWLNQRLVAIDTGTNAALAWGINLAVPGIFGVTLLVLWEGITRGLEVPTVLLPPPSMIWERITNSLPILWADFQQTFLKAVLAGYVLGSADCYRSATSFPRFRSSVSRRSWSCGSASTGSPRPRSSSS